MAPTICTEKEARVRSSIRDSRKKIQHSSSSSSSSVISYVGKITHRRSAAIRNGMSKILVSPRSSEIGVRTTTESQSPSSVTTTTLPGTRTINEIDSRKSEQEVPYSHSSNSNDDASDIDCVKTEDIELDEDHNYIDDNDIDDDNDDGNDGDDDTDDPHVESTQLDSDCDMTVAFSNSTTKQKSCIVERNFNFHKITKINNSRKSPGKPQSLEDGLVTSAPMTSSNTGDMDKTCTSISNEQRHCYYTDGVIVRIDRNTIINDDSSLASTFSSSSSTWDDDNSPTNSYYLPKQTNNTKGLLDIAVKTVKLIKRNQMLQRKLAQLQYETRAFIESVLANPENQALREKIARTKHIET